MSNSLDPDQAQHLVGPVRSGSILIAKVISGVRKELKLLMYIVLCNYVLSSNV